MTYTAKVAVCSDIHTHHSAQSEHHVEILNINPGGTLKNAKLSKFNEAQEQLYLELTTYLIALDIQKGNVAY
jgi:hypothetical protein